MTIKQKDAKQVSVSFCGIALSGFVRGEFVRIEVQGDAWGDDQGADGETVRWATNETRATATAILQGSSASNDLLTEIYNRDKGSPNGAGVGPFEMRDGLGTSKGSAPEAWIMAIPTLTKGVEAEQREWKFRLNDYSGFIGGNRQIVGMSS